MGEEHPFSVLDFDKSTGQILITFKVFGKFTTKLAGTKTGEILLADGPYGNFTNETYDLGNSPRVFIAGGIGITPFVRHILDKNAPETHLFYANQTSQTASYRSTLKNSLGRRYVDIFSRQEVSHNNKNIESGHINKNMLEKYINQPQKYNYFICGPKEMINTTESSLKLLGVPSSQIHSEKFEF